MHEREAQSLAGCSLDWMGLILKGRLFCFVSDIGWRVFRNVSLFSDCGYVSARSWS